MRNRIDDPDILSPEVVINMLYAFRDVQVLREFFPTDFYRNLYAIESEILSVSTTLSCIHAKYVRSCLIGDIDPCLCHRTTKTWFRWSKVCKWFLTESLRVSNLHIVQMWIQMHFRSVLWLFLIYKPQIPALLSDNMNILCTIALSLIHRIRLVNRVTARCEAATCSRHIRRGTYIYASVLKLNLNQLW